MTDLRDTDQALVGHLRTLGDEWGPLGVALVAAQLADPAVVHARLDDLLLGDGMAGADTGHTSHACECGHHWDGHMAVSGGCGSCSCRAHPPNQPAPTERWPHDTWPRWPNIPTTGVHAGQRPAPSYVNLVLWLLLVLAAGCATGAALALLVR